MSRCIACGVKLPCEGTMVCWACEHGFTPVPNNTRMYWQDILQANDYCKRMGWASYRIEYINGSGYAVEELRGKTYEYED